MTFRDMMDGGVELEGRIVVERYNDDAKLKDRHVFEDSVKPYSKHYLLE